MSNQQKEKEDHGNFSMRTCERISEEDEGKADESMEFQRTTEEEKKVDAQSKDEPLMNQKLANSEKVQKGKPAFICDYCQKKFSRSSDLKQHVTIHTGQKDHHCHLCDFSTAKKGNLTVHIRRLHLKEGVFKCQEINCGAGFETSGDLKRHQIVHTKNIQQFSCSTCSYKTYSNSHLSVHVKNVHGKIEPSTQYFCHFCDYSTTQKGNLTAHIRRHLNERPFKCEEINCRAAFKSSASLKSHQNVHNKNNKQFSCSVCPFKTHVKSYLAVHVRKLHSESKPTHKHFCSLCDASFVKKEQLEEHIRRHLNERPFKCQDPNCGAAFVSSSELRGHQNVHNKNNKQFACSVCPFKTGAKRYLNIHEKNSHSKSHHNNVDSRKKKGFLCTSCPYKTNSKYHLTQHIKSVHSELKPFKCPFKNCDYSAKRKGNVNQHVQIHSQETNQVCPHPDCDFKTKWTPALKRHVETHSTAEKRYKCHFCEFSSHQHESMLIHIRRHTGETPFACPLCPYKSRNRIMLKKHMKKHED